VTVKYFLDLHHWHSNSPAFKMAKASNKSATKLKKNRGRQSDFSGEKKAYLDGLAKDFLNRKDRSTFYNEVTQGLVDQFGYSRDGKVYVEAGTLTAEEKLEYYQALRSVSVHFTIKLYWSSYTSVG
jgi:hypothetical protein